MTPWYVTPRWLAFHLVVAVAVAACALLGLWQLHRAQDLHAQSLEPVLNASRTPVPVDDVLAPGTLMGADAVGRQVVVTGTYDNDEQIIVPGRSLAGATGIAVLTPLVTGEGDALVIDRGFLRSSNGTSPTVPPAPGGTVRVTGWLAPSEDAPSVDLDLPRGEVGSIHLPSLANEVQHPLYDGYLLLNGSETQHGLLPEARPTTIVGGSWPVQNVFYAIEWWFFGLAALAFWVATLRRGPVDRVQVA